MATLNLYLPDTLKAEMDQIEGTNWSAVAQEAFKSTITARKASTMDTAAIATRLKATAGTGSARYRQGHEEGKKFAAEFAEMDDLDFLSSDMCSSILGSFGVDDVARDLARHLDCEVEFIFKPEYTNGPIKLTESRIQGFVDGAREVYQAVKPILNEEQVDEAMPMELTKAELSSLKAVVLVIAGPAARAKPDRTIHVNEIAETVLARKPALKSATKAASIAMLILREASNWKSVGDGRFMFTAN